MATWTQIPGTPRSVSSVQATTEAAPTQATDGLYLDEVAGFVLYLVADAGQTLNAAGGSLLGYRYDPNIGTWARAHELDIVLGASDIGGQASAWAYQVASPRGRVAHVASGVGVTSGGLTLYYFTSYLSGKNG